MKILCYENKNITEPARYVISYLLNRLGYFFDWIKDPDDSFNQAFMIHYAPVSEKVQASIPVLHIPADFDLINIEKLTLNWKSLELNQIKIPIIQGKEQQLNSSGNYIIMPFDFIANIYYHLARIEEISFVHPDDVDLNVQNSILFKYGKFKTPVVDILIDWFATEIEKLISKNKILICQKALYPAGEEFAIALTHDVDFIRAYHPIKKMIKKFLVTIGLDTSKSKVAIEKLDDDQWGFDRLLEFYHTNNFNATFFFIPKYLEQGSLRYRITSSKIKKLFIALKKDHHEIAFHPSRYAFENPSRYVKEKRKLEKTSHTTMFGMRHHYLRCTYPGIWQTAKNLDLLYNSGLIYRWYSGFRAGTSFPFPAFNHHAQSQTGITEFPVLFFENTLPGEGLQINKSKIIISDLFNQTRKFHSYFTILWHTNNFFEPESYAHLWRYITGLIEAKKAYLASLIEHLNWQKKRNSIKLIKFERTKEGFKIYLEFPTTINRFCILVPAGYSFQNDSGLDLEFVGDKLKIKNILGQKEMVIRAIANAK